MILMWIRSIFSETFVKMTGRSSCLVRIGNNKITLDAEYFVIGDPEVEIFIPKKAVWDYPPGEKIGEDEMKTIKHIIPLQLRQNDGMKSVLITEAS